MDGSMRPVFLAVDKERGVADNGETSEAGDNPPLCEAEDQFKAALSNLIDKVVDHAVGRTLLVLRDEGILKDD